MKHENIARAIGNIDDKLLMDAQIPVAKKTPVYIRHIASIAACLLLVVGAVRFMAPDNNVSLSLSGQPVESQTVSILQENLPRVAAYNTESGETVTVNLDIEAKGRINILTETGSVMTYQDGTEMDYGQSLSRRGVDSLVWTIEGADVNETYTLQVNDLTVTLSYWPDGSCWTVCAR